jgi:hypothetical protein
MRIKPLMVGLPVLTGLMVAISACESPETEIETPSGETEIERPDEAPVQSPGVTPAPTTSPTTP